MKRNSQTMERSHLASMLQTRLFKIYCIDLTESHLCLDIKSPAPGCSIVYRDIMTNIFSLICHSLAGACTCGETTDVLDIPICPIFENGSGERGFFAMSPVRYKQMLTGRAAFQ